MVLRRAGDVFGDSYAFPGGVLDHDESESHGYCRGRTAAEADAFLGVTGGGLDFYTAVIRELFEETGILLARDRHGRWADTPDHDRQLQEERRQVDRGELRWSRFLRDRELTMACDALHYFAHLETPLVQPKRWSARFFIAELPPGQDAVHDGRELTDSRWLRASDALSLNREGKLKLPFPTIRTLNRMSEYDSVDALIAWADRRATGGVEKLRPVWVEVAGESKWVVRGDEGYPEGGDGCP